MHVGACQVYLHTTQQPLIVLQTTTISPVSIVDDLTRPSKRSQIPDVRAKNRVLPIELLSISEQNSTPVTRLTGVIKEPPANLEPEGDCGSKSEAQSEVLTAALGCPCCHSTNPHPALT